MPGMRGMRGWTPVATMTSSKPATVSALASVPSVLLRRRGRPIAALAWLLALFALPALGGLSWWAFGRGRLERKRKRHSETKKNLQEHLEPPPVHRDTVFDANLVDLFRVAALGDEPCSGAQNPRSITAT